MSSELGRPRWSAAAGAAVAVLGMLASCTSGTTDRSGPSGSPSPDAPASEPVELRVSVFGAPDQLDAYRDLTEAFTDEHPHVRIRLETSRDRARAAARLRRQLVARTPPDVFLAAREQLPGLVEEERVLPLDDLLEERQVDFGDGFLREALTAFSAESALQCMPHDVSPLVVYYNEALLDPDALVSGDEEEAVVAENAPSVAEDGWDWEQFVTAATESARGEAKGLYIEPVVEALTPFVWSSGADIVDDEQAPTTLTLSEADARAAIEQVLTLLRDPQVTPTEEELAEADAVSRFRDGRLAMIVGTRALTPRLREAEALRFDVLPLPSLGRYTTLVRTTGYCVSADTEHVAAAADFVAFAVGEQGSTITARPGYVVPANVEVAHSPAFQQPGRPPENGFVFTEAVRRAGTPPYVENWATVRRRTAPLFERLFYAPVIDLESMLGRIDVRSDLIMAPAEQPD